MRASILAILAYTAAGLTLAAAALTPFLLIGAFSAGVAHAGLHIDPAYSGGTVARILARPGYNITVYQPVRPHLLQRVDPFVQVAFSPTGSLPARVSDEVDLDGDGQPDVRISFRVPGDPHARPQGEVVALNDRYRSFSMPGRYSFSQLLVRSGDAIVVRVPLNKAR